MSAVEGVAAVRHAWRGSTRTDGAEQRLIVACLEAVGSAGVLTAAGVGLAVSPRLALGIVGSAIALLVAFAWTRPVITYGVPAALLVPPSIVLRLHRLPDMTPLRAIVLLCAAAVLCRWLIYNEGWSLPRGPAVVAALLIGWVLIAIAAAPSVATAREGFALSVGTLAPAALAIWAVRTEKDRERLVGAILAAMSVAAALGIFEIATHHQLLRPVAGYVFVAGDRGGLLRAQSVFPQPILFGVALAMCLPLAVSRARTSRVAVAQVILLSGALLATLSRGPWLGAVAALLALAAGSRRHRWRALVALVFALGALYLGSATVRGLVDQTINPTSHEYVYVKQYRTALLGATWSELKRSPLSAHLDPRKAVGLVGVVAGSSVDLSTAVDNTYARYGLELGAVGLALILLMLLLVLRETYATGQRAHAASQVALLACAATVGTLTFPQIGVLFWLLAGAALGSQSQRGLATVP